MKYVDVNVFIYWLNAHPRFGETATKIIERIDTGEKAITSAITPWFVHIVFSRSGAKGYSFADLLERLNSLENLNFIPLEARIYPTACSLAEKYRLDLEDALHLAVALNHKVRAIYSNDEDFDKGPIERVFE
jgi:predicted nucleic acid-binding protein